MKKLTDFEYAAIGSAVAVIADLNWLAWDVIHAGRWDHAFTSTGLVLSLIYTIYSIYKHRKTGSKPVQGPDDIDYRIALYMRKQKFEQYCSKERAHNHRRG